MRSIHLLAPTNQEKGVLLEKLTEDLLRNLGYSRIRSRQIRNGEELDVEVVYVQPLPNGTANELSTICECKALARPIDMPQWNVFKGKLFSARARNANALGILISLSGANSHVRENIDALRKTPEGSAVTFLDSDDIVASLVGAAAVSEPSTIRQKLELLCPNRLAILSLVVAQVTNGYRCFWVQRFFDDSGQPRYYTIIQGDGAPAGSDIVDRISSTQGDTVDQQYVSVDALNKDKISETEEHRCLIHQLAEQGPSQFIHLSPETVEPQDLAEAIISFINTNDGKIVIGAEPGKIHGVNDSASVFEVVKLATSSQHCRPELSSVKVDSIQIDSKDLVVISVTKQDLAHCTTDGRCLIRNGASIKPNFNFFREWSFETQPVKRSNVDKALDLAAISEFKKRLLQQKPALAQLTDQEIAERFGCVEPGPGTLIPTNAGILLFGKDPCRFFPSYGVTAVRFHGTEISEDSTLYLDRIDIDRPISETITILLGFIRRNTRASGVLEESEREELFDYPIEALREAAVNAIVHADYSLQQKISVYIFDDRIEFKTPGGLPRGASIQKLRNDIPQHFPRNPIICDVMQYLNDSFENLGSGMRRLLNAMSDHDLPKPTFVDDGNVFQLTLWGPASAYAGKTFEVAAGEIRADLRQADTVDSSRRSTQRPRGVERSGFILASGSPMESVLQQAEDSARFNIPVYVFGETGVGKELVSKYIHSMSGRADNPFVPINCPAIPESLFESELFGHEKGSFTGAVSGKAGAVEVAHGGTILFDEVSELPMSMQVKLLRFLESYSFTRVGGTRPRYVDIRVISASNTDIMQAMAEGRMRSDFLYRITGIRIEVPPLRERKCDIPVLITHFTEQFREEYPDSSSSFTGSAFEQLCAHDFEGNVRHLHRLVYALLAAANDGHVGLALVKKHLSFERSWRASGKSINFDPDVDSWRDVRERAEFEYFRALVDANKRERVDVSEAAAKAGMPLSRFYEIIKRLALVAK